MHSSFITNRIEIKNYAIFHENTWNFLLADPLQWCHQTYCIFCRFVFPFWPWTILYFFSGAKTQRAFTTYANCTIFIFISEFMNLLRLFSNANCSETFSKLKTIANRT